MFFRFVCVLMILIASPLFAQERTPDEPIMGSGSEPSAAERMIDPALAPIDSSVADPGPEATIAGPVSETVPILVIGDALAGGMGAGMTRLAEPAGKYEISNRFNESSGMARPEFYDWAEAVPKIIDGKGFKVAVVLVGTNDRQDIRVGQFRYAFNTPEWTEGYKLQIDRVVDALKAGGLQVFWVSLPPMGDAFYNKDMMMLNDIIKDRVTAKGETFVDIRPAFLGTDGSYADRGLDETGTEKKLRSRDGVTFFKAGNNRLGQLVLAAIEARQTSPVQTPTPASGQDIATVEKAFPDEPVLGQSLGGGESETFDSGLIANALEADAQKAAEEKVAVVQAPAAPNVPKVKIIDAVAASGTDAEKLLTTGIAPSAPAGRFDDFSFVAPPPAN